MDALRQYEVVWVNLDPTIGSEMKKTRPCVILSPDEMNRYLKTIIIAPMTTTSKPYPTRVAVDLEDVSGWIALDQIRTLDRTRVFRKAAILDLATVSMIKRVIREMLVD
jgi:mRNA interferase MazF